MHNFSNRLQQSGIALPMALILLFVMTLIGVTALNTATLQEEMTGNLRLRQVAFNAAEATLNDAERFVTSGIVGGTRVAFFGAPRPDGGINPGDNCEAGITGGLCTPAQFNSPLSPPTDGERWEDTALNVFETPGRYMEYSNYADSDLEEEGVYEAPRFIIEFMGNVSIKERNFDDRPEFTGVYQTNCATDSATGKVLAPNDEWPFCASDPKVFRITVRAVAGTPARQAAVMLQSTVRVP